MAKSKGLSESTYEYMLGLILNAKLKPGEKIPEEKISKVRGVSRTPVRNAVSRLEKDGLIEIFPNRFARVVAYDANAIVDVGMLRIAVDTLSIKLGTMFGSLSDFISLKETANMCIEAAEAGDSKLQHSYDESFHVQLVEISKNKLLLELQQNLQLRIQFIMLHHPHAFNPDLLHLNQHVEIADALINHDEKKALDIAISHLSSFYEIPIKFQGDYFGTIPK